MLQRKSHLMKMLSLLVRYNVTTAPWIAKFSVRLTTSVVMMRRMLVSASASNNSSNRMAMVRDSRLSPPSKTRGLQFLQTIISRT